jgi:hypothetical protein
VHNDRQVPACHAEGGDNKSGYSAQPAGPTAFPALVVLRLMGRVFVWSDMLSGLAAHHLISAVEQQASESHTVPYHMLSLQDWATAHPGAACERHLGLQDVVGVTQGAVMCDDV